MLFSLIRKKFFSFYHVFYNRFKSWICQILQLDLKYLYGWNYYTMKFIGIWPEERKWNQASNYLVLIPFLMMLCFICAPQTINLSLISNDFNLVIENLSMGNITITLSLLKTIAFWINGKRKYYIHIVFHELIFLQNYYIYKTCITRYTLSTTFSFIFPSKHWNFF